MIKKCTLILLASIAPICAAEFPTPDSLAPLMRKVLSTPEPEGGYSYYGGSESGAITPRLAAEPRGMGYWDRQVYNSLWALVPYVATPAASTQSAPLTPQEQVIVVPPLSLPESVMEDFDGGDAVHPSSMVDKSDAELFHEIQVLRTIALELSAEVEGMMGSYLHNPARSTRGLKEVMAHLNLACASAEHMCSVIDGIAPYLGARPVTPPPQERGDELTRQYAFIRRNI